MSLWRDILTPSRDETAYEWALVALGHALIGAAIAGLLSLIDATTAATVAGPWWWPLAVWGVVCAGALARGAR